MVKANNNHESLTRRLLTPGPPVLDGLCPVRGNQSAPFRHHPILSWQVFEHFSVKVGVAPPGLARDDFAIADAFLIDPRAATAFHLETDVFVARQVQPFADPGSEENLDAVADRENPP